MCEVYVTNYNYAVDVLFQSKFCDTERIYKFRGRLFVACYKIWIKRYQNVLINQNKYEIINTNINVILAF